MIPGLTSKVSEEDIALATTISPKTDVVHVTDTTSTTVLTTIRPPYAGFSGILIVINESGDNITTVTTGNIQAARTIPVNMPILFIYSKTNDIWFPGAIS